MHTTNYFNAFIQVAEDCPVQTAEIPPLKKEKSLASFQFEMIEQHPYQYTSDDVIFGIHALRNGLSNNAEERAKFFSRGQPCLRSSPLGKRYGWGVHSDEEGKVAIYPLDSAEYDQFASDDKLAQTKAMRSKRA